MKKKINKLLDEIDNLVQGSLYTNYVFNRLRSPEIPIEDWRKVFGKNTDNFEFLYQREKELCEGKKD